MQVFLKKEGERPSGPPAERALSFLIIPKTTEGVKITDERPVVGKERGCITGSI